MYEILFTPWQTWQRPTLPRLKTKYHRRRGVSRPSSEWDRVQPPRHNHQVGEGVSSNFAQLVFLMLMPTLIVLATKALRAKRSRNAVAERRLAEEPARFSARNSSVSDNDEHCLMRAIKSIELLVPVSYMHCCTSTPGLSTWWSSTTLEGELVLRWVSRLDAFSGYPFRT
jgi:hypothetical protein